MVTMRTVHTLAFLMVHHLVLVVLLVLHHHLLVVLVVLEVLVLELSCLVVDMVMGLLRLVLLALWMPHLIYGTRPVAVGWIPHTLVYMVCMTHMMRLHAAHPRRMQADWPGVCRR